MRGLSRHAGTLLLLRPCLMMAALFVLLSCSLCAAQDAGAVPAASAEIAEDAAPAPPGDDVIAADVREAEPPSATATAIADNTDTLALNTAETTGDAAAVGEMPPPPIPSPPQDTQQQKAEAEKQQAQEEQTPLAPPASEPQQQDTHPHTQTHTQKHTQQNAHQQAPPMRGRAPPPNPHNARDHPRAVESRESLRAQRIATNEEWRKQELRDAEERSAMERAKHEAGDHTGHQHLPMSPGNLVLFLLVCMVAAQTALHFWKKRYYRSYQQTTLALMWALPLLMASTASFWRFIGVWVVYSAITSYFMLIATRKPLGSTTPRRVYSYFNLLYRACNVAAIFGYVLLLLSGLGAGAPDPNVASSWGYGAWGILCLFYGLYFGVLSRDCAEMCADRMASVMGYYNKGGLATRSLPSNTCTICDQPLLVSLRPEEDASKNGKLYQLDCGHKFHELCLRGWTMIGKKDVCPYCSEKVNRRKLFRNFWETQSLAYSQILDAVRYILAWNPVILIAVQVVLWIFFPNDVPV